MLAISSLGALIINGFGLSLLGFSFRRAVLYRKTLNEETGSRREKADHAFAFAHVLEKLKPSSPNATALFHRVQQHIEFRDLDDASSLRAVISGHVPGAMLEVLRLDVDEAANLLRKELRDSLREYIYYSFYEFAPYSGPKRERYIHNLTAGIDSLSAAAMLDRAKGLAAQPDEQRRYIEVICYLPRSS